MLHTVLSFLVLVLGVQSLSIYSFKSRYEVVMSDNESNSIENYVQTPGPPPHAEVAKMARYIVHTSAWGVLAFRSLHPKTSDFPVGTILSVSDGPVSNSSGVPYVYVSKLEDAVQDTEKDSRCSLILSLDQGDYCRKQHLDPQFPTCAQVWLVGRLTKVPIGTAEWDFAKEALFTRHPSMKTWPESHHFFFMKLDIEQIAVQDYFGGPVYVDLKEYYSTTPF